MRRAIALILGSVLAFGCEGEDEVVDEVLQVDEAGAPVASYDTAEAALMSGGELGLTGSQCTSCGCTLERSGTLNGCPTYRCVCSTEAQARCVTGKSALAMSFAP